MPKTIYFSRAIRWYHHNTHVMCPKTCPVVFKNKFGPKPNMIEFNKHGPWKYPYVWSICWSCFLANSLKLKRFWLHVMCSVYTIYVWICISLRVKNPFWDYQDKNYSWLLFFWTLCSGIKMVEIFPSLLLLKVTPFCKHVNNINGSFSFTFHWSFPWKLCESFIGQFIPI